MKEKPILFSGEMVRAILDGRKKQTRRLVKYIPALGDPECWCYRIGTPEFERLIGDYRRFCPYGAPGDRLWVRETWRDGQYAVGKEWDFDDRAGYRASFVGDPALKWKPSIHMPRWASRLTLEVVSVRVERLQDITPEDCQAEGIEVPRCSCEPCTMTSAICTADASVYVDEFRALWDSINGKRAPWESNPWVWVVSFKVEAPHA